MRAKLAPLLLAGLFAMPVVAQEVAADAVFPTEDWSVAKPVELGVDAGVLDALHREFEAGEHGYVDGMLLVRAGKIAYEKNYRHDYQALFEASPGASEARGQYNYYDPDWHPFKNGPLHTMQSVSKSVTSALVGIAIDRGEIPGLDVKASRYLEAYAEAKDVRKRTLTLRHLLAMAGGIEWDESTVTYTDPRNSCAAMERSSDWVKYVTGQPMADEPGSTFVYNSGITVLLAHILHEATGKHADEYAIEHLFGPLGIEKFYWKKTPTGIVDTEGGLYLAPRDLARFGWLYANDGVWNGKRILPKGWVAKTVAPSVEVPGRAGWKYGFQWWLIPYEGGEQPYALTGLGYGGQFLFVLPEYDTVAVFTAWNIFDKPSVSSANMLEKVLEAIR